MVGHRFGSCALALLFQGKLAGGEEQLYGAPDGSQVEHEKFAEPNQRQDLINAMAKWLRS